MELDELKERFLNHEFDAKTFEVEAETIAEFARACGETVPRFTDPNDPDFQAPPTFASTLVAGRSMPADFPNFGGIALDGGKAIVPHKPIRPGVPLVGRSHVHDIYFKTGRSGRMVFVVSRMEFFDPDNEKVATADTRLVIREKPAQ